jgi:hypothetical protein
MTQPEPERDDALETPSTTTDFEAVTSKEQLDKIIAAARKKDKAAIAELQPKARRLAELEQANLTESEKQTQRIRELEGQLRQRETAELRYNVASAKGVPAERITGSTREELEQSADDLLAFINERAKTQTRTPKPVGSSGASNTDNRLDPKERAAAAMRQYYSST